MLIKNKLCKYIAGNQNMDDDEREILEYGMDILLKKILFIVGAIIIAVLMKSIKEGLMFIILFSILRQNAGGVHMNSQIKCAVSSALIYIASIILINLAIEFFAVYMVLFCSAFVGTIILLMLAPVDTPNKRINQMQKEKNSLKVKFILLGLYVILLFSFLIDFQPLCCVIVVVVVIETILVTIGKLLFISSNIC